MAVGGDASRAQLDSLTPFERTAFRLVRRMNQGRWKRLWCWCDREIGARWIEAFVGSRLEIHGLERIARASRERPLLLAANHRSFFDMYVVMALLFRRTDGWRDIYFPVRGRFFYQSPLGVLLNFLGAWWAMYPPFFHSAAKRRFDQYAFGLLTELCREGTGRLVGFHPEGTRNKSEDPYSFLPVQSGIGHLILEARPQLMPVFIAGLSNSLGHEMGRGRREGNRIRVHFGEVVDYRAPTRLAQRVSARAVAEEVMQRIRALAEEDRARYQ
ncbi:MAG TPA: lysophospholipid acyltransferase family protein, partial [Gemmatimonadales bacterium]|nr:lysophospholipid acyltransferase family protein [Gemmatimonadales bacterium]